MINNTLNYRSPLNYISGLRLLYSGYVFVNQIDGKALVYDGKRVNNISILNMTDSRGVNLYDLEMSNYSKPSGGYMVYYFKKIDSEKEFKKISFVKGYKDFEWIIGAGNYLDELEDYQSDFIDFFYNKFVNRIWNIMGLLFLLTFLIYFISKKLSTDFNVIINNLMIYIDKRLVGEKRNDYSNLNFQMKEIKNFIVLFDDLVDQKQILEAKQKEYANNLERLVEERTATLEVQTAELKVKNNQLERVNDIFIDREYRIKELRDQIEELKTRNKNQNKDII